MNNIFNTKYGDMALNIIVAMIVVILAMYSNVLYSVICYDVFAMYRIYKICLYSNMRMSEAKLILKKYNSNKDINNLYRILRENNTMVFCYLAGIILCIHFVTLAGYYNMYKTNRSNYIEVVICAILVNVMLAIIRSLLVNINSKKLINKYASFSFDDFELSLHNGINKSIIEKFCLFDFKYNIYNTSHYIKGIRNNIEFEKCNMELKLLDVINDSMFINKHDEIVFEGICVVTDSIIPIDEPMYIMKKRYGIFQKKYYNELKNKTITGDYKIDSIVDIYCNNKFEVISFANNNIFLELVQEITLIDKQIYINISKEKIIVLIGKSKKEYNKILNRANGYLKQSMYVDIQIINKVIDMIIKFNESYATKDSVQII